MSGRSHLTFLAFGVILVAFNLRPLVVAVSPLLTTIRADTGISPTSASLLTTLPVLCFGLLAPLAPRLGRWVGIEPALLITMAVVTVGAAIRLLPPMAALLAGTVLIGAGIALANVLIPGVIKRDFPRHVGLMTGLYTMTLSGGPALAAGLTVPLAQITGLPWREVLALWGIPALLAIVVWLPQVRRHTRMRSTEARAQAHPVRGLWRDRLAWAVTCYMGLQSLSYYTVVGWLPTRLADAGMSAGPAGAMLALATGVSVLGAFVAPTLVGRGLSARAVVVFGQVLYVIALIGVLLSPIGGAYLWMLLLGFAQGSAVSLALLFIVQRAPDIQHTAQLSSMAQSFGYVLAAVGPLALGVARQLSGGWTIPWLLLLAVMVPQAVAGVSAASNRHVRGEEVRAPSTPPVTTPRR
jgi:CP family cyanate transporter-like MFS transporter